MEVWRGWLCLRVRVWVAEVYGQMRWVLQAGKGQDEDEGQLSGEVVTTGKRMRSHYGQYSSSGHEVMVRRTFHFGVGILLCWLP
jgi:hypothetical protein